MSNAIEHFSRHRVDDTTLQVMADAQRNIARLIAEEESVIRHYGRLGNWPHKRVNMFVLDDLRPLVTQIKNVVAVSSIVVEDVDNRPMVNVYDASDLSECAVFVNRRALKEAGVWDDNVALRALLAHEHGHPLAENATVHAARELALEVLCESRTAQTAIGGILQLLAIRLCLHAPQEVFANEMAIRAGFGDALLHLDMGVVAKTCLGVGQRPTLVQSLDQQMREGKLGAEQAAALLLVGDLQGHLVFALETAAFLRAGEREKAEVLEGALARDIWRELDPAAGRLYEEFRDHYLRLRIDMTPTETRAWAGEALVFLAEALRKKNLSARFDLVQRRSRSGRSRHQRSQSTPSDAASVVHEDGLS